MKVRVSVLLIAMCSMAGGTPPPPAPAATGIPPSDLFLIVQKLNQLKAAPGFSQPRNPLPFARACQLGTDCLTMDARPFEMCQLSSTSCGDKLAEVLQVQRPTVIVKPAKAR